MLYVNVFITLLGRQFIPAVEQWINRYGGAVMTKFDELAVIEAVLPLEHARRLPKSGMVSWTRVTFPYWNANA